MVPPPFDCHFACAIGGRRTPAPLRRPSRAAERAIARVHACIIFAACASGPASLSLGVGRSTFPFGCVRSRRIRPTFIPNALHSTTTKGISSSCVCAVFIRSAAGLLRSGMPMDKAPQRINMRVRPSNVPPPEPIHCNTFFTELTAGYDEGNVHLVLMIFVALLVWTHGRAVMRSLAVLTLAGTITLWAVGRRVRSYLVSPRLPAVPSAKPLNGHSHRKLNGSEAAITIGEDMPRYPTLRSSEIVPSLREVWRLHDECLALKAASLLRAVEEAIAADPNSSAASEASLELASRAATAATVRGRLAATIEALRLFEQDSGWSGSIEVLGSHTRFRHDDGRMTLKIEGVVDGVKLGDVLAVWREVEHFDAWLPSCTGARLLRTVGQGDVLFHMNLSVLGGAMVCDAVVHTVPPMD